MLGVFANNLAMHLAFRGNINNHIVNERGMTTQAMALGECPFTIFETRFGRAKRRQVLGI